ncbi:MAG: RecQ family ATP-dependent DNA helicase [Bacteroidales bacterium]|jgi:ATP-dependent DNA helicase RecQ|nr:RecQ family ATP-dependent DNA helicase [Bacteroidales bacterium]
MSAATRAILQQYWGYPSFRPLQEDIVDSVMAGKDTLALLPTGGGKSICFQVPAMAMEGLCLVITPLIALMKDQVAHLVAKGIHAAAIYSGMHPDALELAYNQAAFGRLKFLYVSPERLQTNQFIEALRRMKVCLLAVDESHCISQWGYDFRPPYLKIADIRPYMPKTPVLALTATATAKVVDDIQVRLGFKEKNVFQSSFERKNVTYNVVREADKYGVLRRKLEAMKEGSAIVYVRNRKRTQVIADWLNSVGISATFYHAGLDAKTRDQRQDLWMKGKVKVIAATNAFGMGIDKPDVRLVIHMDLPDSIEAYFQEAGRAGRDLKPSEAFLLVSPADIQKLQDNLAQSFPELDRIKLIYNALGNYFNIPVGAGENVSYPFVLTDFANRYGFNVVEVFHTLKILEKEGFLVLSDSFDEPSKVMVKASRDDIYGFQVNNPQYGELIKCMLRSLPGVMTDFVKINEETLAKKTGLTAEKVQEQLKKLESYNFLSYAPRNDKPQILFLSEFVDTKHFGLSKENYYDRKKDAEERVKAVVDFVNNDRECRSVQLLRYFNEKTKKTCGRCDVCQRQAVVPYDSIEEKLRTVMGEEELPVKEVLSRCDEFDESQVLDAIRFLVDNGVLQVEDDGMVKRNDNKKSRR